MEEAEVCDRIGIIDHGKIIALDSPSGLKRVVGGDVVIVKTSDKEALLAAARERFGLSGQLDDEMVYFETERGESFIPELVKAIPDILEVRLRQPTLEDVFLKLTGRAIRDTGSGKLDAMRIRRTVHQRRRQ
jgi:ABC-2 type transport system ATP-binding protein